MSKISKNVINCFLAMCLLLLPLEILASQVCFVLQFSALGELENMENGDNDWLTVNDSSTIDFTKIAGSYEESSNPDRQSIHYDGCKSARFFKGGSNKIRLQKHTVNRENVSVKISGTKRFVLWLSLPNRSAAGKKLPTYNKNKLGIYKEVLRDEISGTDIDSTLDKTSHFYIDIEDLAPVLVAEIKILRETVSKLLKNNAEQTTRLRDIDLLEVSILELNAENFMDFDLENFNTLDSVKNYYLNLRAFVADLQAKVKQAAADLLEEFRSSEDSLLSSMEDINLQVDENHNYTFEVNLPERVPSLDDVLNQPPEERDEDLAVYDNFASATINALSSALQAGNRQDFLSAVHAWHTQNVIYQQKAKSRQNFDPNEWDAYTDSVSRVETYLFNDPGPLDREYWFKDNPFQNDIRHAVQVDIAKYDPVRSQALTKAMNAWRPNNNHEAMLRYGLTIKSLAETLRFVAISRDADAKQMRSRWETIADQAIEFAKQEGKCLAISTALDTYGDFAEAVSGYDICTGEKLSGTEQVISAASIFIPFASGKMIRLMGKMASLPFASKAAFRKAGDVVESSKTLGVKTGEQFKRLTDWMKTPLIPGETGSIKWKSDLFVDLASSQKRTHILTGDARGGGHMWPGKPGKSIFPQSWNGDKIMHEVSDIVTDPRVEWKPNRVVQGKQRYKATGVRDNVEIDVIIEPEGVGLVTSFPQSGPGVIRNPK